MSHDLGQPILNRLHRFAQRDFRFGADEVDALLVLPLNLRRPDGVVDAHQVSCRHHDAARRADEHVVDVVDVLALVFAQADDDRVFLPGLAEQRRLRAGDVGANRVRQRRGADAEQRGLGPVDADRQLRPSFVAAEARIGDARRVVEQLLEALRQVLRLVEIFAANLEREPAAAVVAAAGEQAVQVLIAARRVRADDDAGNARKLAAQILRNLFARARPLVLRLQQDVDVAAAHRAAAAAGNCRRRPALTMIVGRFGHQLVDRLLDPPQHRVGDLDARALRQLHVHVDLALVGLRRELGRQRREDQRGGDDRGRGDADDDGAVLQRLVQQPAVAVVHAARAPARCRRTPCRTGPSAGRIGGGSFSSFEQSTGTSVTATNSDMASEKQTTTDSWRNMTLETPVRKSSGTKTAMCVRIEARIADHTSSLPSIEAVTRSLPWCSMCRYEFSSTTMAASTTMPTPSASPPNVIVFSVMPEK